MANEQNLRPIRDSKVARELQEKSVIKRKENALKELMFKEAIKELLTEEDFKEIILDQIKRAKDSDYSYAVLRDTLGQKPGEELKLSGDEEKPFEVNIKVIR